MGSPVGGGSNPPIEPGTKTGAKGESAEGGTVLLFVMAVLSFVVVVVLLLVLFLDLLFIFSPLLLFLLFLFLLFTWEGVDEDEVVVVVVVVEEKSVGVAFGIASYGALSFASLRGVFLEGLLLRYLLSVDCDMDDEELGDVLLVVEVPISPVCG